MILSNQDNIKLSTQTGAATLVMTSALVLTISLTIVYGAQQGILEQRISANDYRTFQAYEAAQAGLDYALTNLDKLTLAKHIKIDNDSSNQQLNTIQLEQLDQTSAGSYTLTFFAYTPAAASLNKIKVVSVGHSGDDNATQKFEHIAQFQSLINYPPPAPVISQFGTNIGNNVSIVNLVPDQDIAVWAGESVDTSLNSVEANVLVTEEGGTGIYASDNSLANLDGNQFFENFFSTSKDALRMRSEVIDCTKTCTATSLNNRPNSTLWVNGDLNLNSNVSLGTPDAPIVLIVDGELSISHPNAEIYGIIYVMGDWDNEAGSGKIHGSVIVEGAFFADGNLTISYDNNVITNLTSQNGKYNYIPGTWKDF